MHINYSQFSSEDGAALTSPELRLQTLSGKTLGSLSGVYDLKFSLNFSELSEISFSVPYMDNGVFNQLYHKIDGYKVVWTKTHGVYLLTTPTTTGSGLEEIKSVKGYSLEKMFERKKLFLEEGTYNFYDPFNPDDTILGRILELDRDWEIGHVSPSLISRYRTFSQYDNNALSFIYGDMKTQFRCIPVFNTYKNSKSGKRTIDFYDADDDISTLPIYLSYDNLVEQTEVTQLSDELITKLNVYGADDLSIREVNPAGSDYVVNLDYFVQNGDISSGATREYQAWLNAVLSKQEYYSGIVALKASSTAKKIALQAELTDLQGELETLTSKQSITIQAIAAETTDSGKSAQQSELDKINSEISIKKNEISQKEKEISDETALIARYSQDIKSVNDELAFKNYFSENAQAELDRYMIEETVTESTFVASSIDTSVSGKTSTITGSVNVSDSEISEIDMTELYQKKMYTLTGGKAVITSIGLAANIIRGTLEVKTSSHDFVCSLYLGTCVCGEATHPSALFTVSGTMSGFTNNIKPTDDGGLILNKGSEASFSIAKAAAFLSANVSDYQKYSVARELYDYGQEILTEKAFPTYEFTVDAANFLFQKEFEPFKKHLKFGNQIYLMLGSMGRVSATFIGLELNYGDTASIELTFSNRFQKHDGKTYLKELLEKTYSASRSFDASKYIYNQSASRTSQVTEFMKQSIDSAVNTIIGATNQSVVINGAGIHVGGENGKYQLRIVDNMIAISDDNWRTAKIAIGMFASEQLGSYFGVNADVIAGKLIVGNNLTIENTNDNGVMQFKVDSSGAWINNGTMVMQKDGGGKILLDPQYGIAAGNDNLFATNGTTVNPSFISDGKVQLDENGMPKNSNFYLDLTNGNAYFRGKLNATSGTIGGFTIEKDFLYSGSGGNYVALNGSGSNSNSAYAFWAGSNSPSSAKFWVKKDGTVKASGTISATDLLINGNSILDNGLIQGKYINAKGISVTNNYGETTFKVDSNGTVTVAGNITANALAANTTIESPKIYGGLFYSTGQGYYGDRAAYYVYNGDPRYGGTKVGYISYDENGSFESEANNPERIIIASCNNMPIKIRGETNVSIEALGGYNTSGDPLSGSSYGRNGKIYLQGKLVLANDLSFGYSLPSSGVSGQLFFKLI